MRCALALFAVTSLVCAEPYFPPLDGEWERVEPSGSGWDAAKLDEALAFAQQRRSTGVVILLDGKILAERSWGPDDPAIEDVASVQKSVASTLLAVALSKNLLALDDTVSQHLGAGWSKATPEREAQIKLRHLITMTSGLDEKLEYEAPPGTKWRYNTTAYQQTMRVLAAVSGLTPNELTKQWLTGRIGMRDTHWIERPTMPGMLGLASSARDLARFGLLILNRGQWAGETVVDNPDYLRAMLDSSQKLNPAYGYLWWLNGRPVVRAAGTRQPTLIPSAPSDLVAALGALGRKVYVVPSLRLVVTRIGANAQQRGEPDFDNEIWKRISAAAP
ncbi:MAG: serine hydrolase [Bryobacterales bacterium]